MNKLAFLVPDLGPSQLSFRLISQINSFAENHVGFDFCVLYESLQRPCLTMNFASMPIAEGWGFDGPVISTSLSTTRKMLGFPASPKKIFFVWDLEWLTMKDKTFRDLQEVYLNPELTLLSRCDDHAMVLWQMWGRKAMVIPDFDLPQIIEVATGEKLAV